MAKKRENSMVEEYIREEKRRYRAAQEYWEPILLEHFYNEDWEMFMHIGLTVYQVMPIAFALYDYIPNEYKYDFCTKAYTHHGDSIPAVRKAVRGALKYGKPKLPQEMADAEYITVYRAGEEPIEKAKYRISWSASKEVAEFFLNTYLGKHAKHLYKGKIKPNKIIAYTNDRSEQEIMQYANVYDIEEM